MHEVENISEFIQTFEENKTIIIKNTISSSFSHYSASYDPQVFISQIGIYDEKKNLIAIAKLANPVRKTKELGAKILAENCGKSIEQIMKDFDRDYWMNAKEAVEYGIVDKIAKSL